jgi:hypothetical protein
MTMEWDGISAADYEALRKIVRWEEDVAPGGILHVMALTDTGIRVTDVWNSADEFNAFVSERLMPGIQELGIAGEPRVEIHQVHALFAPGLAAN